MHSIKTLACIFLHKFTAEELFLTLTLTTIVHGSTILANKPVRNQNRTDLFVDLSQVNVFFNGSRTDESENSYITALTNPVRSNIIGKQRSLTVVLKMKMVL